MSLKQANPDTATQFGIRGITTVLLFKDGKIAEQFVGRLQKDAYSQAIKNQI